MNAKSVFESLRKFPVVDGEANPLDQPLQELFKTEPEKALRLLNEFEGQYSDRVTVYCDFFQCLARLDEKPKEVLYLATINTRADEPEIRDAAIHVFESSPPDRERIDRLNRMAESDSEYWIRDYARQVAEDLEEAL